MFFVSNQETNAQPRLELDERRTGRYPASRPIDPLLMFNEDQQTDDQQALAREVVPRTLQSLFVLRISLCVAAAVLSVAKISLSPPSSAFLIDLLTNTPEDHEHLSTWMNAANLIVSGLLAAGLALIIATFLIQARVLGHVGRLSATNTGGIR